MIDAFRYAGRALGVQLGAHIKTQVEHFSNILGFSHQAGALEVVTV